MSVLLMVIPVMLGCWWGGLKAAEPSAPNILILLVDDMGYSDISCYGGEIPTPHIDDLAVRGLRMTDFYNAARCCPSRASLLSGMYPHKAGMGHQNQDRQHPAYRGRITERAATLAEILQSGGYVTYQVGKWHVGSERAYWPDKKGFDHFFTLIEGAMNYYNRSPWVKGQDSLEIIYQGKNYRCAEDFYATRTFSDTASAWIERHDPDQPFFMYLAYNAPHWPLHAPGEDVEAFRGKFMDGWDHLREQRLKRMKELGIAGEDYDLSPRFHSVPAWNTLSRAEKEDWDLQMALYAAVIRELDRGIGQVIHSLNAKGQLENTLIIFLSDNGACHEDPLPEGAPWANHPTDGRPGGLHSFPSYGPPWANVSNTPFRYFKSYLHEGGIKTPLIVQYPGVVPAGMINHLTLGHVMDLLPTCLDFAGMDYPGQIGGRQVGPASGLSLRPAFCGEEQAGHDQLFWEHEFHRAVRKGRWKLVSAYRILDREGIHDQWELYDLRVDPVESEDLSGQRPDLVDELERLYLDWARDVRALSPEEMKNYSKR